MAKLCDPTAAVRQPGRLPASSRRPLGFAPPPHDGFAFIASAQGCACRPTSLQIGYKFATIFEVVGIFFDIFLVLRTEKVHRGFIGARYGIGGVGLVF